MVIGSDNDVSTNYGPVIVMGDGNYRNGSWGIVSGRNNNITGGDDVSVF